MRKPAKNKASSGVTAGGVSREMGAAVVVEFPGRWWQPADSITRAQCVAELRKLGERFEQGAAAMEGLYLRMAEHIRHYQLQPDEVREALGAVGMAGPRVSELLRVAAAPEAVYREYSARLIGFKVALQRTRLCRMVARSSEAWARKKLARTARNLLKQARRMSSEPFQFAWRGWVIIARPELDITNIVRIL